MHDLLNRPLRDLRISVTDRCNFRCSYCMPADIFGHSYQFLPRNKILSFEEIRRLVNIFAGFGVTKVRITGGEPLLRQDVERLIGMIAEINGITDIAMTTNGYLLAEKAQLLRQAGLHRLTVSLDTLDNDRFKKFAGKYFDLQKVLTGLRKATAVGFGPIKINTVVRRYENDQEIPALIDFARQHGYIIRFIEYMDVGNLNRWKPNEVVTAEEIVKIIANEVAIEPLETAYRGEVASRYRFLDGRGEFGVISSISQPFCTDCTRVRLSAEGKLYTCLFATEGLDVREALRSGADERHLRNMIGGLWSQRQDRYSELRFNEQVKDKKKVEMYHIGG